MKDKRQTTNGREKPTAEQRRRVKEMTGRERGVSGAASILRLDRATVLRILAGQPVNRGSLALLAQALSTVTAADLPLPGDTRAKET